MTTKMVFHGSDIEKICAYYHLNKEDIVKFGANVNPLGLSASVKKEIAENIDLFSSYPDRDYVSLRNTIAAYCQIPAEFILPGNGSSELISLLIQERAPKHTLILGPTYSEYSRELSFSGSTQEYYHLQEERNFTLDVDDLCKILEKGYDFLIICNPNNPTSSAIMQEDLRKLIAFCAEKNIFVMIDETYVEFAPDINAVTAVPLTREFTNLMVLRGISKFYAAPGMRLGYGITGNRNKDADFMQIALGVSKAFEGAADAVNQLKKKYRVIIGADSDTEPLRLNIRRNGMEPDGIYSSEDLKIYKPDRRFYQKMLHSCGGEA